VVTSLNHAPETVPTINDWQTAAAMMDDSSFCMVCTLSFIPDDIMFTPAERRSSGWPYPEI